MNKINIYAKSSLCRDYLESKMDIGCDGIEIQLLRELIRHGNKKPYLKAEDVFDLSSFNDYPIKAVHAPITITDKFRDVGILDYILPACYHILEETCKIANHFGEVQGSDVIVIIHNEESYDNLINSKFMWYDIIELLWGLLDTYPRIHIAVENISPVRSVTDTGINLCGGYLYDTPSLIRELRKEINTNRLGTVLDTCHAEMSVQFTKQLSEYLFIDYKVPEVSMKEFFNQNKDVVKLIHMSHTVGTGVGKGKHGQPINTIEGYYDMIRYMTYYKEFRYTCPITLEVAETDYLVSDGYEASFKRLRSYIEGNLLEYE